MADHATVKEAMLPKDLPEDLPSFVARFGTDEQCRAYLVRARWPQLETPVTSIAAVSAEAR